MAWAGVRDSLVNNVLLNISITHALYDSGFLVRGFADPPASAARAPHFAGAEHGLGWRQGLLGEQCYAHISITDALMLA